MNECKINIKACDTRGRRIVKSHFEHVIFYPTCFVYAGKALTEESTPSDDDDEEKEEWKESLIKSKKRIRNWSYKVWRDKVTMLVKFFDPLDSTWTVRIDPTGGDTFTISVKTEEEINKIFEKFDQYIFQGIMPNDE